MHESLKKFEVRTALAKMMDKQQNLVRLSEMLVALNDLGMIKLMQ